MTACHADSRSPRAAGVMSMWNSRPRPWARRASVASEGSWLPASSRLPAEELNATPACLPGDRRRLTYQVTAA